MNKLYSNIRKLLIALLMIASIAGVIYFLKYQVLLYNLAGIQDNLEVYRTCIISAKAGTPEDIAKILDYVYNYYPDGQRIRLWKNPTAIKILLSERRMTLEIILNIITQKTIEDTKMDVAINNEKRDYYNDYYYDINIGNKVDYFIEHYSDEYTKQNWLEKRKFTDELLKNDSR